MAAKKKGKAKPKPKAKKKAAPKKKAKAKKAKPKKKSTPINTDLPMRKVPRSKIKLAEYNPRSMDASNRDKLRDGLQEFGLVESLVWNERTGNLVGGHQRMVVLDGENKHKDYSVPVTVVDLDPARERALNVALNNPSLQGDWDYDKLKLVLVEIQTAEIDIELTGFDEMEIKTLTINMDDASYMGGDDYKYGDHQGRSQAADVPYIMFVFDGKVQVEAVRKALGIKKGVKRVHLADTETAMAFFERLWKKDKKRNGPAKGKSAKKKR